MIEHALIETWLFSFFLRLCSASNEPQVFPCKGDKDTVFLCYKSHTDTVGASQAGLKHRQKQALLSKAEGQSAALPETQGQRGWQDTDTQEIERGCCPALENPGSKPTSPPLELHPQRSFLKYTTKGDLIILAWSKSQET